MNRLPFAALLCGLLFFLLSCSKTGNNIRNSVIIMGSSIAAGEGASSIEKSWAGRLAEDNKADKFVNLSVGASTTYNFLPLSYTDYCKSINRPAPYTEASVSSVIAKRPDFVILSFTTNDVKNGFTPEEYLKNIQIITDSLEKAKIRYLVTSNILAGTFTQKQKQDSKTIFLSLPVIYGQYYVDIMTPLVDTANMEINKSLFISDNTHPNDDGHFNVFSKINAAYKRLTN